jgi:diacylglycerol kinase family enzyme
MLLSVIGKGHFVSNGLSFAPQAKLTGGKFGVTVVSRASVWDMISFRSRLTNKEKIERHEVSYFSSKKVKITVLSGQMPIETDGEFLDILYENESIVFELDQNALCMVV